MRFTIGDKIVVAQDLSGGGFDEGAIGDTGVVIEVLGQPNPLTGFYPGLFYQSDRNGKEYLAWAGELIKL